MHPFLLSFLFAVAPGVGTFFLLAVAPGVRTPGRLSVMVKPRIEYHYHTKDRLVGVREGSLRCGCPVASVARRMAAAAVSGAATNWSPVQCMKDETVALPTCHDSRHDYTYVSLRWGPAHLSFGSGDLLGSIAAVWQISDSFV